jgi:hypothetical protein
LRKLYGNKLSFYDIETMPAAKQGKPETKEKKPQKTGKYSMMAFNAVA